MAKVLNPIIQRFTIKVKEDFDFERAEDLEFIKLDTNKTIILIDEPERSLYPDIQQEIIGYYTQFAPKAQFFFATHSPIIASSFEPWEIVVI